MQLLHDEIPRKGYFCGKEKIFGSSAPFRSELKFSSCLENNKLTLETLKRGCIALIRLPTWQLSKFQNARIPAIQANRNSGASCQMGLPLLSFFSVGFWLLARPNVPRKLGVEAFLILHYNYITLQTPRSIFGSVSWI